MLLGWREASGREPEGKLITREGDGPQRGCPPKDRLWVYFEDTKNLTRLVTELACIKKDAMV